MTSHDNQLRAAGAAPAEEVRGHVLLLHASAGSARQWRSLVERLGKRFHVSAPDLYGHGQAPTWPGTAAIRMTHEAERAASLSAGGRFHVVGHSFGGAVALRLAMEQQERVRSLLLVEPAAFHLLRDGEDADQRLYREITRLAADVSAAVLNGSLHAGAARFVDYWNGPRAWERLEYGARDAIAARLPSVALNFRAALTERLPISAYATLDMPVRLLRGEHSPAPTRRICELLARALGRGECTVIPGAGHMSPLSHPDAVNETIVRHLESCGRPVQEAA